MRQTMNVICKTPLIATRWMKHGDHPHVFGMNGSNWESFPNEDDVRYGLLGGGRGGSVLVESGDWIVWNETFYQYAVFKPAEFAALFSQTDGSPVDESTA